MSPKQKKRVVIKKKGGTKDKTPPTAKDKKPEPKTTVKPDILEKPQVKEELPLDDEFEELEAMTLPDPTLLNKGAELKEEEEKDELPELEKSEEPPSEPIEDVKDVEPQEPEKAKDKRPRPLKKAKKKESPKSVEPTIQPEPVKPSEEEVKKEIKPLKSMKEVEALLDAEEKPLKISKTLLIIGIILCGLGLIGMLGLRAGFVQSLLGDAAPYPGIGTVEPTGHIVSVVPIILGLVTIFAWGLKSNPAYYELEKRKSEEFTFEETEEPEDSPVSEDSKEPPVEVKESPLEEPEPPSVIEEPESEPLKVEEPEEIPTEEPSALAQEYAKTEDERIAECERILGSADIEKDDEKRLRYLIATGITPDDFTTLVEKAEKKKKEEELKKLSSEQKAAVLEEELAAELAELEEELTEDEGDKDMEAKILKEIEDLEGL
jgi:hypothetical protein